MSHYHHITIDEREKILLLHAKKITIRNIAKKLNRSPSTISREIKRNQSNTSEYSAIEAQRKYVKRRKRCRRKRLLDNKILHALVKRLFLECQWSPEQIANRLKLEQHIYQISYTTIYRGIYARKFDEPNLSHGNRGAIRKLRHRGKTRRTKGTVETRGKIKISNTIYQRPIEANNRLELGHWEADTVAGKTGSSCLLTLTDRRSRYLLSGRIERKKATHVSEKMIELFSTIPLDCLKTITPDRGKEFAHHEYITKVLNGVEFYFPDPHAPWQRGTNENTNGLLREYFPKNVDIDNFSDAEIRKQIEKINLRPRKCLGWKSAYEMFFDKVLHLT